MRHFFLCTTILAALLLLPAAPALAAAPEAAIPQLQKAIDGSDAALLEKHMDVRAVVDKGVDAVLADPAAMKAAQQTPAVALLLAGMGADPSAKAMIKNVLAQETREFVLNGVSSGAFAGKKPSKKGTGLLSPLFADASKGRKEFGPARLVERKGPSATVATSLYDYEAKERYPLELRLLEEQGVWRVKEVLNVKQLVTMASGG